MPLVRPSLDYTDKDFDALELRVRNLISAAFPDWSDDNVADFGNILKDLFCFLLDVLTKYQDAQARETRWTQATQLRNILSMVKLLSYSPALAAAATATEAFTLSIAAAADVVLPAGTRVLSEQVAEPVAYQLLAPLAIPAGQLSASASVENSAFQSDSFASSGLPNQSFVLAKTPYLDGSLAPVAGDGAYTQVDNFLASTSTSKHFTVTVDQNDRATITFGNGVNGSVPQGTITAPYKTGGGAAGRVDQNTLKRLEGSFTDIHGAPVTLTCTNPAKSVGGADRATVAQIQALAPEQARVTDRAVAREDFEIVAKRNPNVARALMLTSDEYVAVQENQGILFLVPVGGGIPSQSLIDAVANEFTKPDGTPYPNTFELNVQTALYEPVDVYVVAYFRKGVSPAAGKSAIVNALTTLFAPQVLAGALAGTANPFVDFGFYLKDSNGNPGVLAWSDVLDTIRDVPSVLKLGTGALDFTLNGERADVALLPQQFPTLGIIQVVDGSTGLTV